VHDCATFQHLAAISMREIAADGLSIVRILCCILDWSGHHLQSHLSLARLRSAPRFRTGTWLPPSRERSRPVTLSVVVAHRPDLNRSAKSTQESWVRRPGPPKGIWEGLLRAPGGVSCHLEGI